MKLKHWAAVKLRDRIAHLAADDRRVTGCNYAMIIKFCIIGLTLD